MSNCEDVGRVAIKYLSPVLDKLLSKTIIEDLICVNAGGLDNATLKKKLSSINLNTVETNLDALEDKGNDMELYTDRMRDSLYVTKTAINYNLVKQPTTLPSELFSLRDYQIAPRNLMAGSVGKKNLLLFYPTGVGKTMSAVTTSETYSGKVIVVTNDSEQFVKNLVDLNHVDFDTGLSRQPYANKYIQQAFARDGIKSVTHKNNPYKPIGMASVTEQQAKLLIRKSLRKKYTFYSYRKLVIAIETIMKLHKTNSTKAIFGRFKGSLMIVDEIQLARTTEKGSAADEDQIASQKTKINDILNMIVSSTPSIRLLYMTATPNYDSYMDINRVIKTFSLNNRSP